MKNTRARLTALFLAFCMSVSAAACGSSEESGKNSDQNELQEAYDGLSDKDKQELDKIKEEIEKEESKPAKTTATAASTTAAETTAAADPEPEDLGIKDPKYYTYLEDLAKNYAENESKNGAGTSFKGNPVYCGGKIYIPDNMGRTLYGYDIEKKELKTEFQSAIIQGSTDFIPFATYNSWFVKNGEIYLAANDDHKLVKVGKDGKTKEFTIPDALYAGTINGVFDNGKILITSNGTGEYEIYDPNSNTNKTLPVISVPSDHAGVNKDIENLRFLFSDGNSFFFTEYSVYSSNSSSDGVIYEYNTDTDETSLLITDPSLMRDRMECRRYGDYLISLYNTGGHVFDGVTITRISDGTVILNNVPRFGEYRGGDCFNFIWYKGSDRDKMYWFKVKYPDSSYDGLVADFDDMGPVFDEAEQLAAENGSHVYPMTDKYYVYEDDAGFFLRTYENGESDEELILTKKQIEDDLNKRD